MKADLHSHLLPNLDDGAKSLQDSVSLISELAELGFTKLITTPHVMSDYFKNTPEKILPALDIVREELSRLNMPMQIEAAAEYYMDEVFVSKLETETLLTLPGNYLLFELSFVNYPSNLYDVIDQILQKGYRPVLAHPERYPYFAGEMENYSQLKDAGCYLQINTISLTGYYGKASQTIAEKLIDHTMVSFIGSDMHHQRHSAALKQSLKLPYVQKLLTDYQLLNPLLVV
ncbi:capsular biosynthesis protein [Pedobacter sp. HMF7647]|uniref:protein-tyrosine-phosphatase n=1 Tax=Hufsiella arboris TaxID=2695275 RepID=A0A7K1YCQ6_9SPHI|nr:capsular biosynthesis protein [Hufsiella arboris]